jgi:hypothetical protein
MNGKQVIFTATIALAIAGAGVSAFADDNTPEANAAIAVRSRADVRAEVLRARTDHTLLRAGELYDGQQPTTKSSLAWSDVKAQVVAARAAGQLPRPGEYDAVGVAQMNSPSTEARATVKSEVLAARRAGELLAAGEQNLGEGTRHPETVAAHNPFKALLARAGR